MGNSLVNSQFSETFISNLSLQTVKEQLPLPPKSPRKRILDDEDDEDDVPIAQNVEIDDDSDDDDDDIFVHDVLGDREPVLFEEDSD